MLGHKAKDRITGLTGVITAQAEFLHAPIRYEITPDKLDKGKVMEHLWLDHPRIEVGKKAVDAVKPNPVVMLGDKVKDNITGFEGVATGRFAFLSGCLRIEVTPDKLQDGKVIEPQVFDEQRLAGKASKTKVGGPLDGPPAFRAPAR